MHQNPVKSGMYKLIEDYKGNIDKLVYSMI